MTSTTDLTDRIADFERVVFEHLNGHDVPDIRRIADDFMQSLPQTQAFAADTLRTALNEAFDNVDTLRRLYGQLDAIDSIIANGLAGPRIAVGAALDALTGDYDETELIHAVRDAQRLRDELTAATQDLSDAVDRGDLAAVTELRARREVELPNALAEAEAEVLALKADAAAAAVGVVTERNRPALDHRADLERRRREAQAEAERLAREITALDLSVGDEAQRRTSEAHKRAAAARTVADLAVARLKSDRVARVRLLAGLDTPTSARDQAEAEVLAAQTAGW